MLWGKNEQGGMGSVGWLHLEQEVLEWAHRKEMEKRGLKETGGSHVEVRARRLAYCFLGFRSCCVFYLAPSGARSPKHLPSSLPEGKNLKRPSTYLWC